MELSFDEYKGKRPDALLQSNADIKGTTLVGIISAIPIIYKKTKGGA